MTTSGLYDAHADVLAHDLVRRRDHRSRDPRLARRRGHEPGAGAAEGVLAIGGPLLVADEPGHARDDEQEEHRRRRDDDHHVSVVDVVDHADARRDEARDREDRAATHGG